MTTADFLDEKRREIDARLSELKPLVDAYARLQAGAVTPTTGESEAQVASADFQVKGIAEALERRLAEVFALAREADLRASRAALSKLSPPSTVWRAM